MTEGFFVLRPQFGQNLLVTGLPAGDAIKVAAGGFADRHALGGKGSADVAEIAFVLRSNIFLGSQSSHCLFLRLCFAFCTHINQCIELFFLINHSNPIKQRLLLN